MSLLTPYSEDRPWGNFKEFIKNEPCTVKIITVNAGEAFSLQTHEKRTEFWHIIKGSGSITVGDTTVLGKEGDQFSIPPQTKHRVEASDAGPLTFLEISTGEFDEKDIIRLEDKYGRTITI